MTIKPEDDPAVDPLWRNGYATGFEAGKAAAPKGFDFGWGKPCAKCGQPVHPPMNSTTKAAFCFGNQIWHGDCVPPGPLSGTFTITL